LEKSKLLVGVGGGDEEAADDDEEKDPWLSKVNGLGVEEPTTLVFNPSTPFDLRGLLVEF